MDPLTPCEKAEVVRLILEGKFMEALEIVCKAYGKPPPRVKIKRVKGMGSALAVYRARDETIYLGDGSYTRNPFILLHELYHHLRMFAGEHRGTEKYADRFALSFIRAYKRGCHEG